LSDSSSRQQSDEGISNWDWFKNKILHCLQKDHESLSLYEDDEEMSVLSSEFLRLRQPIINAFIAQGITSVEEFPRVLASLVTPNFLWEGFLPDDVQIGLVGERLRDMKRKVLLAAHRAGFILSMEELLHPSTIGPFPEKEVTRFARTQPSGRIASVQGDHDDCILCLPHILVLSIDFGQDSLSLEIDYMYQARFADPYLWNTWPHLGAKALAESSHADLFWAEVKSKIEELILSVQIDQSHLGEDTVITPDDEKKVILLGDAQTEEGWAQLRDIMSGYEFLQMPFEPVYVGSIMSARRALWLVRFWCGNNDGCLRQGLVHSEL
jgi:hypothetical protein